MQPFSDSELVLRWSYGGLMIQVTENCLELSTHKGRIKAGDGQDRVRRERVKNYESMNV